MSLRDHCKAGTPGMPDLRSGFGLLLSWLYLFALLGCDNSAVGSGRDPGYAGVTGTGNAGRLIGQITENNRPVSETGFTARLLRFEESGSLDLVASSAVRDTGSFEFDSLATGDYLVEIWKDDQLRGQSGRKHLVDSVDLHVDVMIVDAIDRRAIDLDPLGGVDSVYVDYRENAGIRSGDRWLVQTLRDTGFVVHTYLSSPRNRWEAWYYLVRDGRVVLKSVVDGQLYGDAGLFDSAGYSLGPKVVALWDFDSIEEGGIVHDRSIHGNDLVLPSSAQPIGGLSGGGVRFNGDFGAATVDTGDGALRRGGDGQRTYEIRFRIDSIPETEVAIFCGEPSIMVLRDQSGKLLIYGEVLGASGKGEVYMVFSPTELPIGKWMDLAVSIDESKSELYAWLNDMPLTMYAAYGWIGRMGVIGEIDDIFEVGTSRWYLPEGWISVDELRVSDSLARGAGKAVLLPQHLLSGLAMDGSDILGLEFAPAELRFQKGGKTAMIGWNADNGSVHRLAVRPKVPQELIGRELVAAWLEGWDAANISEGSMKLEVCPILNNWDGSGLASEWSDMLSNDGRIGSDCTHGRIFDGSNGDFLVDVTNAVKNQMSGLNQGFILRAKDERMAGKDVFLQHPEPVYRLVIRYIYR